VPPDEVLPSCLDEKWFPKVSHPPPRGVTPLRCLPLRHANQWLREPSPRFGRAGCPWSLAPSSSAQKLNEKPLARPGAVRPQNDRGLHAALFQTSSEPGRSGREPPPGQKLIPSTPTRVHFGHPPGLESVPRCAPLWIRRVRDRQVLPPGGGARSATAADFSKEKRPSTHVELAP